MKLLHQILEPVNEGLALKTLAPQQSLLKTGH